MGRQASSWPSRRRPTSGRCCRGSIPARRTSRRASRGRSRCARSVARVDELQRRDRQHGNAASIDQERIFVGAVARAAVLDDAQPARRDLIVDAMVERDDAVGDVLLEPLPRERVDAALAGDHGRDAPLLQPGEQAPELGAQDRRRCSARQKSDSIVSRTMRRAPTERSAWSRRMKSAFEVVLSRLLDLRALDPDVFDRQPLAGDEVWQGRSPATRRCR